jgi:hypothetical protein
LSLLDWPILLGGSSRELLYPFSISYDVKPPISILSFQSA